MDLYQSVVEYLMTLRIFDSWDGMEAILRRAASGRPRDWHLPIITCQAVGESAQTAIPASAALACAQISIILVDDMLDDDPRGEYHRIGHGQAANYALAFQAAGAEALLGSGASTKVKEEALKSLSQMMSTTALGQELDIQNPADENLYWHMVEHKSAPFYGCAFHLGAILGEAKGETANGLKRLGEIYGEMIQIHDDLNDTMAVPANPDWLQGRKPLPTLFALLVDHPDHDRFTELFQNISTETALQEAQEILIRCGAVSYCVDQLLNRHNSAQDILKKIDLSDEEVVASLLQAIVAPVQRLFDELSVSSPVLTNFAK